MQCKYEKSAVLFLLTMVIEKTFQTLQDIHQQKLLAKFHENLTLPGGGVDSIFGFADSLTLPLNILTTSIARNQMHVFYPEKLEKFDGNNIFQCLEIFPEVSGVFWYSCF